MCFASKQPCFDFIKKRRDSYIQNKIHSVEAYIKRYLNMHAPSLARLVVETCMCVQLRKQHVLLTLNSGKGKQLIFSSYFI